MQHDITSKIRPRIRIFMLLHRIWALFERASFLRFYAVFISHFNVLTRCIREWTDLQRVFCRLQKTKKIVLFANSMYSICIKNGQNIMKNNYIWTMEKGSSRLHCTKCTQRWRDDGCVRRSCFAFFFSRLCLFHLSKWNVA